MEIDQERDPKTFIFFQIELWVDIHFFFKSSSELVSKFKNSIRLWKSIKSAIQRLLFFFRLSYGLISTFFSNRALSWFLNSKILFVFGNRSRARSKDFYFFQIELWVRYPKTFIFFQIEWVDIHFFFKSSSELVSKFKNSIRLQKSIKSAIQRLLFFFRLSYGLISTFFSNRALSWFLNSKILFVFGNRSRARSKDFYFFSD